MIFNPHKQEWEYYEKLLNSPNLELDEYGIYGKIVDMNARTYYEEISKMSNSDPIKHMKTIKEAPKARETIDKLKTIETPINIPVINYSCKAQEGRHRAMAFSEVHGEDALFPCLLVYKKADCKEFFSFWEWMRKRRKEGEK